MDKLSAFDWSLIASFLAVARTGSLSAAAQKTGQSQPTLGRHIRQLEEALAVDLFARHPKGLRLTEIGAEIAGHARDMQGSMAQIALIADAQISTLAGEVRIASSIFAAHYVLPPVIAAIRRAEPEIALIIQPSDDSDNLTFREADIALRMYRPEQTDLVTLHLCDVSMGVFAAHRYLEGRSPPRTFADLFAHDLVGYDASTLMLDVIKGWGQTVEPGQFATRTDNQTAYWELVKAGCGVGFTQAPVGRGEPLVEELFLDFPLPALPVWLTAHETVRRIPRVDRVWQHLRRLLPNAFNPR